MAKLQEIPLKAKILKLFSSPVLLHYTLPILMLFLIIGTIAQKYIGLYDATQMFFASPFFWLGPVPLPGLPIILTLISLNLAGKLIFKSPWTLRNAGVIITHIGALLLMMGGLLNAAFSEEGYLDLVKGKPKSIVSDYHAREWVILSQKGEPVFIIDPLTLKKGQVLEPFGIGVVRFEILDTCRHCEITRRQNADETFHGMAQHMELTDTKPKMANEENMGGVTFQIKGLADETQNGVYLVLEDVPKLPEFQISEETYRILLRKVERSLPFSVELLEFKREVYPGTDKPKSYESIVRIHDNGLEWQSVISMNAPLRYKGYTFFQSSFINTPQGDISVLAVVWNVGRTFPYVSSLAMCVGLLIHLLMRRRKI